MAYTKFATSEPFDAASGARLNKLGDELQEQINVLNTQCIGYSTISSAISSTVSFNTLNDGFYTVYNHPEMPLAGTAILEVHRQATNTGSYKLYGIWGAIVGKNYTTYSSSGTLKTPWESIATTTKTSFNCTAKTGYTIISQNCFTMNGVSYIELRIKKTDDTAFSTGSSGVANLPSGIATVKNGLSAIGSDGSYWNGVCSAIGDSTSDIIVCTNSTTVKTITISGVVV